MEPLQILLLLVRGISLGEFNDSSETDYCLFDFISFIILLQIGFKTALCSKLKYFDIKPRKLLLQYAIFALLH